MVATGFAWFAHELVWAADAAAVDARPAARVDVPARGGLPARRRSPTAVCTPRPSAGSWPRRSLIVGPLQIAWLLLGYGDTPGCACPDNVLQIADAPAASEAIVRVQQGLGAALARRDDRRAGRRWRGASPSRRLAIAPVLVTGAVAFALIIPWTLNDALDEPLDDWPDVALQLALAAVPVAFLVGLLRTRLARGAVADLVVELGGRGRAGHAARRARAGAARPVADRRLLAGDDGRYVDADGRPVDAARTARSGR